MEIYLSINNREKVIKLPHLPPEIIIESPQGNETYQTTTGELNLIGNMGLKTIAFESYLDNWTIFEEIEAMRRRMLPLRLIITETPINAAVTVDEFEATMRRGNKVWYSIKFKEFRFLGGAT